MNKQDKKLDKSIIVKQEEEVLKFWDDARIFEKSLKSSENGEPFVFYDGPPFATGLPHYGHILASTIKDVIPRYQTMKGRHVRRVWGWDCHGLPIETLVEKELKLENKKSIEAFGVGKFNEIAKNSVLKYDEEWKKLIPRIGRWIDMDHGYKTMDTKYTESVWWAFKKLYEKNIIYKGFRSMHMCPRCETTLSLSEVSQGYKDITDISITAKFELTDEPNTYLLAWTTTPWTLPGNVALAVGVEIEYEKIKIKQDDTQSVEFYIVAKNRISEVFKDKQYDVVETIKGEDIVGKKYKPPFCYFSNTDIENKKNGWKVYGADFVNLESGTGIVHIAPAFGEDDMNLGKQFKLPFVQHVSPDGKFTSDVKDFVGQFVKPKDNPQATDINIIKHLAHNNLLFSKEKIKHSYPHCWRCETPLLNYATSSWFIEVSKMRDSLLAKNKDINWIPGHLKEGRFGKWLENARDWSISRTRFWGAPLPVWQCEECDESKVIGSVEDIKQSNSRNNTYFLMRHGQSHGNKEGFVSSNVDNDDPLTKKGREQVVKSAENLKQKGISRIFASSFLRTKETAEITAKIIGINKKDIIYDDRLWELNIGNFNKKPLDSYSVFFKNTLERFTKANPEGETLNDTKGRLMDFLYETDKKFKDEKILIVGHAGCIWLLSAGAEGLTAQETAVMKDKLNGEFIDNAEVHDIGFTPLPHNELYELDLHRPNIDQITIQCSCGKSMCRIPDVFDCWVESGAMPFAQFHYPFENKELFEKNFPADFIAEGLDQTRGWFYTMLVLCVALFEKSPYKNVVTNGLILAEDGRKMSKSLKNYPEPWNVLNKHGADALRYYMLSSPIVRAEELKFSEQGVDGVAKKVIMRLMNTLTFYKTYSSDEQKKAYNPESKNVLDRWIVARLNETTTTIELGLDKYELDKATRSVGEFVGDFSTWYIRRSRDRFKGVSVSVDLNDEQSKDKLEKQKKDTLNALETTRFVLVQFSKIIAPIIPFVAESVFQKIKGNDEKESVHLEKWPMVTEIDFSIIEQMKEVRLIVSLALEERARLGIRVRQPLPELKVLDKSKIKDNLDLIELIKEDVNVKKIVFSMDLKKQVELNATITPELKKEGLARELVRRIQETRKKLGLTPKDEITINIDADDEVRDIIETHIIYISKTALIKNIKYCTISGEEDKIEIEKGKELKIKIL